MNKLRILALTLLVLVSAGCLAPRVPQTELETPFGLNFRGPKDMELEFEGVQYQRATNGTVTLTAKSIKTKSRNNPAAIDASSEQIKTHWDGVRGLAGDLVERAAKGAKPVP